MDENKEKKSQIVIEEKDNDNPKKRKIIFLIIAFVLLIIDLLLAIILFPKIFTKGKSIPIDYTVDERIPTVHNHLISYLDSVRTVSGVGEKPKKIVGLDFVGSDLKVMSKCDSNYLYFDIAINDFSSVDSFLLDLNENIPSGTKYSSTVIVDESSDKELDLSLDKYISGVTQDLTNTYASYIGIDKDNVIHYCVREEFQANNKYENEKTITSNNDKLLYDLLFFIITL